MWFPIKLFSHRRHQLNSRSRQWLRKVTSKLPSHSLHRAKARTRSVSTFTKYATFSVQFVAFISLRRINFIDCDCICYSNIFFAFLLHRLREIEYRGRRFNPFNRCGFGRNSACKHSGEEWRRAFDSSSVNGGRYDRQTIPRGMSKFI